MATSQVFSVNTSHDPPPMKGMSGMTSPTHGASRRSSIITQTTERILNHLFRFRKGSAEVNEAATSNFLDPFTTDVVVNPREAMALQYAQVNNGESSWLGATRTANTPNANRFPDTVATTGPTRFHETEGWESWLGEYEQRRSPINVKTLNSEANYEADTEQGQWQDLNQCSTRILESPKRKRSRKDSRWGIPNLLTKSRRLSKESKGKQPAASPNGSPPPRQLLQSEPMSRFHDHIVSPRPPKNTPSSAIFPLTLLNKVIPSASEDDFSVAAPPDSSNVLYASCSSSKSSISSAKFTSTSSSRLGGAFPTAMPMARPGSKRSLSPPPGRPEVCPYSSNESLDGSSTSPSSIDESIASSSSSDSAHQDTVDVVASSIVDAEAPSLPIDIPLSHGSRRSSTQSEVTARPNRPHYLRRSISQFHNGSTSRTTMRRNRPETAPASPLIRPTKMLSTDAMQALSLGPPRHPLLPHSESTERLLFHISVEHLATPTPPQSPPPPGLSRFAVADDEDRPDFSLSHPAPPSLPRPSRRMGTLRGTRKSGDMRLAYYNQSSQGTDR
ncbi:hypothetical protein BKA66DRAFT_452320 [Pyrenochaeta sp. MPI-SDFR-AT-0127]|nr:hypothetical protein BKA66DRAFT_452320 [Pyrenochaeta sp. MPI-SDFR-AT-0127]